MVTKKNQIIQPISKGEKMNEPDYRYGKVYINKKNGRIAEVLNTWLGNVFFLCEVKENVLLAELSNDGKLYFDDMP